MYNWLAGCALILRNYASFAIHCHPIYLDLCMSFMVNTLYSNTLNLISYTYSSLYISYTDGALDVNLSNAKFSYCIHTGLCVYSWKFVWKKWFLTFQVFQHKSLEITNNVPLLELLFVSANRFFYLRTILLFYWGICKAVCSLPFYLFPYTMICCRQEISLQWHLLF